MDLAITSVWVAPILLRRLRLTTFLLIALPLLALDLLVAALVVSSAGALVACIVGGAVSSSAWSTPRSPKR